MKKLFILINTTLGFSFAVANEVRILAWDDSVANRPLAWFQGGKQIAISDLHPLRRSKPYHLASNDSPVLIRALDRISDKEKTGAELLCSLDPKFRQPLLILLPDPVAPSGLRALVMEDDLSSFGWGGVRFVNASGLDVVVQVERKAARVPAGWKPVDIRPGGSSRNVGIRIAFAGTIETPAYTSVWDHRDDARSLVFVLRGGESRLGNLVIKAIPELKDDDSDASAIERE